MTKAALLVAVFAAACTDDVIGAQPDSPTTPIAAVPTTTAAGDKLVIATGGAATVAIEDTRAIGLSGSASQGFAVSPFERDAWPNTTSPEYWIRAHAAGAGSFEIVTSKGIATGLVHAAPVARVALLPASYELAGDTFALAPNRTEVVAALYAADGRRLVDATLAFSAEQTAWDRALATGPLTVTADSFGERTFAIEIVDGIDRIESVRSGDRTCFHAYRGTTEVVIAMTIEGGTPDASAANCARATDGSALRASY